MIPPVSSDSSFLPADNISAGTSSSSVDQTSLLVDRQRFQSNVYRYLADLRSFHADSPADVQRAVNDHQLTELAHVLARGDVFATLTTLAQSQRCQEQSLSDELNQLRAQHSNQRSSLRQRHRDSHAMIANHRPHHLPVLEREQEQEMASVKANQAKSVKRLKIRIIHSLDGQLVHQQTALGRLGLTSLFFATSQPDLIRMQMRVIDWLMRLAAAGRDDS